MVDNEAINDSQSIDYVDGMQATNGADDTQVANVPNELTQVIDGLSSDTLKEISPSKISMPTNHDSQHVEQASAVPIVPSSQMEELATKDLVCNMGRVGGRVKIDAITSKGLEEGNESDCIVTSSKWCKTTQAHRHVGKKKKKVDLKHKFVWNQHHVGKKHM
jgi:hypothetical protein